MKTNLSNKNFALSLAFIMRFKATRKWLIDLFKKLTTLNRNELLKHPVHPIHQHHLFPVQFDGQLWYMNDPMKLYFGQLTSA